MRSIVSSDFLKVQGTGLVNENGKVVALRGTNFGGWLIQESWMCPVYGIDRQWANLDSINALKSRGFSHEEILDLYDTYQDNWITETDFDELSEMGVNCIRIPFWYRNFMKDLWVKIAERYKDSPVVAGYVGEFNNGPNEEYAMQQYNKLGISWTTWAYKGAKQEQVITGSFG
ncbi:hypothetical protein [Clostridium thermarum]|uniref:hypothetical protein n=1 Tax=Clostridium thermarum TaxID=1716543 RepID=UPI00111EA68A|nr:hypothetical protein [Clostridium thermarum]